VLGVVDDIQRMVDTDYLVINTDDALVKAGFAKSFLLQEKKIYTKDAKDILEAS